MRARNISHWVCSSTKRELDGLVLAQRLAERRPSLCELDGSVDAELSGAKAGRSLTDAVLVKEVLDHRQAATLLTKDGRVRNRDVVQRNASVIGGHVECPQVFLDHETGGIGWHQETR